jgi:hypothetical protein
MSRASTGAINANAASLRTQPLAAARNVLARKVSLHSRHERACAEMPSNVPSWTSSSRDSTGALASGFTQDEQPRLGLTPRSTLLLSAPSSSDTDMAASGVIHQRFERDLGLLRSSAGARQCP